MAKRNAAIRLVSDNDTATQRHERKGTWQGTDDVFFHRSQVSIGTTFFNMGRLDHGTVWTVTNIRTITGYGTNGYPRWKNVHSVQHLFDELMVEREGSNETRRLRFSNMSYSAIWRLRRT